MLAELEIVDSLCRGVDPRTGVPLNTPRSPEIDERRLALLRSLQSIERQVVKTTARPQKHGASWETTEDQALLSAWRADATLAKIADLLGRSETSIAARLVKIGECESRELVRTLNASRTAAPTLPF